MRRFGRWSSVWMLLGLSAGLGCSDDGATAPTQLDASSGDGGSAATADAETPTLDYELFDNTVLLDEAMLAALTSVSDDQTSMIFSTRAGRLGELASGNVILAGTSEATPHGLLRLVTSVAEEGEGLRVETEAASVYHAFRRLDLDLPVALGVEEPEWSAPPPPAGPFGVSTQALTATFPIGGADLPLELFDGDGLAETSEDRIAGSGTLQATVTLHFWLHFDWEAKSVEEAFDALGDVLEDLADTFLGGGPPSLGEVLNLRTGLTIEGDIEAATQLQGKAALAYHRNRDLGGYPLPEIVIGPLVFVPEIALEARFDGGVLGEMSAGAGITAHAGLGFSYDADDGVPKPFVIGPDFTHEDPSATLTAAASLRTELELKLKMQLYGLMGPYVSLVAYSDVEADRSATPCLSLTAGLEGHSGASIGVFGHDLATFMGPSIALGDPLLLATGDCAPPPDPSPTDALIEPWSRSYEGTVWSTGIDDGWTDLQLHHDGRLLLTSSGATHLMKVEEDGTPVWARTFEQPDRPGITVLWPQHAVPALDTGILVTTFQNVLVKLDAAGTPEWAAQVEDGNAEDGAFWTAQQVQGDLWLAGTYREENSDERQALLVILGTGGELKRAWTWGGPDHREAVRDVLPLDDGALLVGQRQDYSGDTHGFVMRVDVDGNVRWARDVDACGDEEPVLATATLTDDGNFIVGGWHYATETQALLFRIAPDGSGDAPAWATATTIEPILGLQPRTIHQLQNGELRVTGRWARTGGNDEVFVAGTDSIGRFAWARWYGGDMEQGPPTSRITSQGGLLVASSSATLEPGSGGLWLFEVPAPNGVIDFDAASGGQSGELVFTSAEACLVTPEASTATTMLSVGLAEVEIETTPVMPPAHDQ